MKEDRKRRKNLGLKEKSPNDNTIEVSGILDILPDGFGFFGSNRFESGDDDIYVSPVQGRRFRLKTETLLGALLGQKGERKVFSANLRLYSKR